MMSLTFGLFTQVSGSGPLGPLVCEVGWVAGAGEWEQLLSFVTHCINLIHISLRFHEDIP